MAVSIASIITRIRDGITMDPAGTIWSDAEITGWIHEAQRDITMRLPGATAKDVTHTCVVGSQQELPDDGARLLTVAGNTAAADGRPTIVNDATGRNATAHYIENFPREFVVRRYHDMFSRVRDENEQFQLYIWESKTPRYFWLYPAAKAGDTVDIVYSAVPDTTLANLDIPDYFSPLVLDYALFRMFAKQQITMKGADQMSARHMQFYKDGIDDKMKMDMMVKAPNTHELVQG